MAMVVTQPCIDCGACVPECPTEAIFYEEDVPDQWKSFIELNATKSAKCSSAHE